MSQCYRKRGTDRQRRKGGDEGVERERRGKREWRNREEEDE